jgi:hypothetical protein
MMVQDQPTGVHDENTFCAVFGAAIDGNFSQLSGLEDLY